MNLDEKQTHAIRQVSEEMMNAGPFRKGRLRRRLMIGHIVVFFAAIAVTLIALGIQLRLQGKQEEAKQLMAYANIVADSVRYGEHAALAGKVKALFARNPDTQEPQMSAEQRTAAIEALKNDNKEAYAAIEGKLETVKSSDNRIAHIRTLVKIDEALAVIVASDDPSEIGSTVHYADPDLARMREGFDSPSAGREKSGGGRPPSMAGYAPIEKGVTLAEVSRKAETVVSMIAALGWIWLLPLAAGLALSAVFAWREAHRIIAPLMKTAEVIQRLSSGDMTARLSPDDPKVTRVLRKSVVELGTSLERRQRVSAYYGRTLTQAMMDKVMEAGEERLTRIGVRMVTLLRADILSPVASADSVSAEKYFEVSSAASRVVIQSILENGGSVDDLESRRILGIFGSPLPMQNHLQAALAAAQNIRRDLANVLARRKREGLPLFDLRLWIHTGEAALGLIGVPDRGEYRAVGEPVDTVLALNVPDGAKDAKVIVTEAVVSTAQLGLKVNTIGCATTPKGEKELFEIL
jgi:class 3 adenylate cyclase